MGSQLCCAAPNLGATAPNMNISRETLLRRDKRQNNQLKALRGKDDSTLDDNFYKNSLTKKTTLKLLEAFQMSIGNQPVKFLSFSQRKYVGFRDQYQYDRKRLLIGTESAFSIIGYDLDENPLELVNTRVSNKEIIKHVGFVEDEKPSHVLLVTKHLHKEKMVVRLLKIKKENEKSFTAVLDDLENKNNIENIVKHRLTQRQSSIKMPRNSFDNYNILLSGDDEVKQEDIKPYLADSLITPQRVKKDNFETASRTFEFENQMEDLDKQEYDEVQIQTVADEIDDKFEFEPEPTRVGQSEHQFDSPCSQVESPGRTRNGFKLPPALNGSMSTFIDNQIKKDMQKVYLIYEIQDQVLRASDMGGSSAFDNMHYYTYSQYKKFLFAITPEKTYCSFLINHRLHTSNASSLNNSATVQKNTTNSFFDQAGTNSKQASIVNKANIQEPILINTHHTQYYGRPFGNNFKYQKMEMEAQVKQTDFAAETLFVVYHDPADYLDVLYVNGVRKNRYYIQNCFNEHGLDLVRLNFVQVPLLKWSTRALSLQSFGQVAGEGDLIKKVILVGDVIYQEQQRSFIMIFNLVTSQAEIIKILDVTCEITCINYGPYDNGHVLIGLKDGMLLGFDYNTLERIENLQVFQGEEVTCITFDPTHYIFVGSSNGKVISLTYKDKKMHYMYLELGMNQFCTVQVPRTYNHSANQSIQRIGYENLDSPRRFCCV